MKSSYIKYVIVAGVFLALAWNTIADPDSLWLHGLGILLCGGLMSWVAWVWYHECLGNKDAIKLESYAEQIYMLGYLLTLSAIGGTLLRLLSPVASGTTLDKAVNLTTLFSVAGVKLITTIFGLVIMFFFKEEAAQWSGYDDTVEKYLERIRMATEKMVEGAETISESVRTLAGSFSKKTVEELASNLKLFSDSLVAGRGAVSDFSGKTDTCAKSQDELKTALEDLKTTAGQLDVGLKRLETTSVEALKAGLDGLTPKLEALKKLFTEAWFADLKKQFDQLQEACTRSVSIWATFEKATSEIVNRALAALRKNIDDATASTARFGASIDDLAAEQFPAFTREFQQITEGAANTRKHVVDSVSALSKAAQSLQTLNGILEGLKTHSADISKLGSGLQEVKDGTIQLRANVQESLNAMAGVGKSLQELNTLLAQVKEHSIGFPTGMAQLRQTVGQADKAFGNVNGRLQTFADGLDGLIARTRQASPVPTVRPQPEPRSEVRGPAQPTPPPVRVPAPVSPRPVARPVATAPSPSPPEPVAVQEPPPPVAEPEPPVPPPQTKTPPPPEPSRWDPRRWFRK